MKIRKCSRDPGDLNGARREVEDARVRCGGGLENQGVKTT